MEQIKGEATVFYSTHILDDVQRVSDYVAILDGRLVRAQRTAELLSSFTRDRMRCARLRDRRNGPGAGRHTGVQSVEPTDHDDNSDLPDPHRPEREWRRAASCHAPRGRVDLTVIDNSLVREDLEDVFMRLVDSKEHAA